MDCLKRFVCKKEKDVRAAHFTLQLVLDSDKQNTVLCL